MSNITQEYLVLFRAVTEAEQALEELRNRKNHVLDARRNAEAQDPPDLVAVEPQFAEAELAGVIQPHHVPHDEDG